ncbi:hypothetical protein GGR51DRAFT_100741 [Nemania sp. FL0031]|nr:hypothetical protein GGR51DRAFT_100741 [Nemania sp. FL0031]
MSAMCTKSYEHFTKCDHVLSSLSTCSTYQRQQESAKRFPGNVLRRGMKKKEDCGDVLPYHLQNDTYCDDCSAQRERLRAQAVDQGAREVRKQGYQDRSHEENKKAARLALEKSRRNEIRNHKVVHTQTSVFGEPYHQPEALAKKDAYTRKAAPAPTGSRTGSRPQKIDTSLSRGTQERRQRNTDKVDSGIGLPTFGSSQPMLKPDQLASTYQYSGRFSNHCPGLPPAVGLPPRPPEGRSPITSIPSSQPPKLRRKSGNIHNAAGVQNQRPDVSCGADINVASRARQPLTARPPPTTPVLEPVRVSKPYWEEKPRKKEPKKSRSNRLIKNKPKIPHDDSDQSFFCETSKRVSEELSNRPQATRTRRGLRK